MEIEPESEVVIAVPTSRTIYPKTSGTLSFVKLFFYQYPTGMQGSGFVILCLCLCNFAALVGNSKPIFNTCQNKSYIYLENLLVAFPIQMLWIQETGNYREIHT